MRLGLKLYETLCSNGGGMAEGNGEMALSNFNGIYLEKCFGRAARKRGLPSTHAFGHKSPDSTSFIEG